MGFIMVVRRTGLSIPYIKSQYSLTLSLFAIQMWETAERAGIKTANLMWSAQVNFVDENLSLTSCFIGPVHLRHRLGPRQLTSCHGL